MARGASPTDCHRWAWGPSARLKQLADDFAAVDGRHGAAGEIGDYADEGEATGYDGQQQGANHTNRPHRTEAKRTQGRLTREFAKRAINRR